NELFDAVLTGSVDRDKKATKNATIPMDAPAKERVKSTAGKSEIGGSSMRKLSLYVGNFPWWTSDRDLMCLAQRLGVKDITDIKFAENRVNGQSRGYAEVVVTSEESLKVLLEKIPQCKLHGESVDCRFATRQNLSIFEEMANKRKSIPLRVNSKDSKDSESSEMIPSLSTWEPSPLPMSPLFPSHTQAHRFPSLPGLFLGQPPPPYFPHLPPNIPPPLPPTLFPPVHGPSQPSSSLHVNPALFTTGQDGVRMMFVISRPTHPTSDADFEELMNRNRAVASTAITKAVSSATAGDLRIAMETLLTAIAIIKQSRVYDDDCCQALVTSLKDCLVSIQGNYRDRERDRDRQDSFGWEGAGTSRRHRERSWSEERDKERTRSREWQRDHRDRYR
uniref:RRM domain-containing protein n=1 Tax=Mola mola TaxID=94237 RepID=A0A3Q4BPH9_MOLML